MHLINKMEKEIIDKCRILLEAYKTGRLGQTKMPEEACPIFESEEEKIAYFTLPMALNYQRNSYDLWESALKTYLDSETRIVFNINEVAKMEVKELQKLLMKHKLALQPNKHTETWMRLCAAIKNNFGSFSKMLVVAEFDFLKLKELIQEKHKKEFPYLSGPKIFNYWCFILQRFVGVELKNSEFIEIAPDTHVVKCSIKLGVIDSEKLTKEVISGRWREVLQGSGIKPIDMHSPLWFWSRNKFVFDIDKKEFQDKL